MQSKRMHKIGLITWTFVAFGCSSAADDSQGDAVSGAGPATAKPMDDKLNISGHVTGLAVGSTNLEQLQLLEHVNVCTRNGAVRCSLSSADGAYALQALDATSEVGIALSKEGYTPVVAAVATVGHSSIADVPMLSPSTLAELARTSGMEPEPTAGAVVFTTELIGYGGLLPLAGVSLHVDAPGSRMVYAASDGLPNAELEASSDAAWGAAVGVPQGTARVSATLAVQYERAVCGIWTAYCSRYPRVLRGRDPRWLHDVRAGLVPSARMIRAGWVTEMSSLVRWRT
jgi:hypothetical protein